MTKMYCSNTFWSFTGWFRLSSSVVLNHQCRWARRKDISLTHLIITGWFRKRGLRPEDHLPDGGEESTGAETGECKINIFSFKEVVCLFVSLVKVLLKWYWNYATIIRGRRRSMEKKSISWSEQTNSSKLSWKG